MLGRAFALNHTGRQNAFASVGLALRPERVAFAVNKQSAVSAVKLDAVVVAVWSMRVGVAIAPGHDKFLAAYGRGRILEDHFERVRNLTVVLDDVFAAEGAYCLGRINAHRPVDDVQQMDAPVGERSTGIIPKGAKRAYAAIAVVGVVRSGPKPKVPVEPGGRIAVRRIAHAFRPAIAVNPCFGQRNFADFSAANELDGLLKMFARALLRAHLYDAVVFCGCLDHFAALGERVREGFFDINILAGFASHDHGDGVPMVGGGNDYCLDVLVVEDGAKIFVAFGLAVGQVDSAVQIGLEGIGDGDGIDLAGAKEVLQVELTHSACANQAHGNPVVGPQDTLSEWSGRSGNGHGSACQPFVEVPASYLRLVHFRLTSIYVLRAAPNRAPHRRAGTFSRDMPRRWNENRRRGGGNGEVSRKKPRISNTESAGHPDTSMSPARVCR